MIESKKITIIIKSDKTSKQCRLFTILNKMYQFEINVISRIFILITNNIKIWWIYPFLIESKKTTIIIKSDKYHVYLK
jgi:hypothetical protein